MRVKRKVSRQYTHTTSGFSPCGDRRRRNGPMSKFGCVSTSPFKISLSNLFTSQKQTQPFCTNTDGYGQISQVICVEIPFNKPVTTPVPFRTSDLPRLHIRSPKFCGRAAVLNPVQEPPHWASSAPHNAKVINMKLVIATRNCKQRPIWAKTDSPNFALARFELWGVRFDAKRIQPDDLEKRV